MMNNTSAAVATMIYCPSCGRGKLVDLHPSAKTLWAFCPSCIVSQDFTVVKPVIHYSAGRSGHGKLAACGAKVWKRNGWAKAPSTSDVERVTCQDCLARSEADHEMLAEVYACGQ